MAALSTFTRMSSGRYETKSCHIIRYNSSGRFSQGAAAPNEVADSFASLTHAEDSRFGDISSRCKDRSLEAGKTSDRFRRRFRTCRATPGAFLRFKPAEEKTLKCRAS